MKRLYGNEFTICRHQICCEKKILQIYVIIAITILSIIFLKSDTIIVSIIHSVLLYSLVSNYKDHWDP